MNHFPPQTPLTAKDLQSAWDKNVRPRFQEFIKGLKDPKWSIPQDYIAHHYFKVGSRCKARRTNPLLRFLRGTSSRPLSAFGILKMLCSLKAKEFNAIQAEVLKPYFDYWNKLFNAIDSFYGDKTTTRRAQAAFEDLANATAHLEDAEEEIFHIAHYQEDYDRKFADFTREFSSLPLQRPVQIPILTEQTIKNAVTKTICSNTTKIAVKAARMTYDAYIDQERGKTPKLLKGNPRGRKPPTDIEAMIIDEARRYPPASSCETLHNRVIRFYRDKQLWKDKKWIDRKGHRLFFDIRKSEQNDKKAIERLYQKVKRAIQRKDKIEASQDEE